MELRRLSNQVLFLTFAMIAALVTSSAAQAQAPERAEIVPGLVVQPNGVVRIGTIDGSIIHFNDQWAASIQTYQVDPAPGFPKMDNGNWDLEARYRLVSGNALDLHQRIERLDPSSVRYSAEITSKDPVPTNTLAFNLTLPISAFGGRDVFIDDQAVRLPVEHGEPSVFRKDHAKKIVIPTPGGKLTLTGDINVYIQDDRRWGGDSFGTRLSFTPGTGNLTRSTFQLTVKLAPYDVRTIDMASAANMGFADEKGDDGTGGWTDQGPDNDLRSIQPGSRPFGGVRFDVIDPKRNNGKSAIVLGGTERPSLPKQATVNVGGEALANLYLLHSTAWTPQGRQPIGTITVNYQDGSSETIEVQSNRDVGNWWGPGAMENGAVVHTAENRSAIVGLYLSKFPVKNKPIRDLALATTGAATWMIVGISGSNDNVPLPTESPVFIVQGADWQPIEHHQDVETGSILDFSFLADGPAGKHGYLTVKDGRFAFEKQPDKPARFYGANLCFSGNFLEKAEAEQLADRFAKLGYNTVRLHHYDWDLIDKSADNSYTLDKQQIDKLDYLIHCFKQRGIYVNIDLYTFRETKAHEIPELNRPIRDGYKALVPILTSARKNWENFARAFLTHVNPYTGMTLAEDPVLIGICPLNEDPLAVNWDALPETRQMYLDRFEKWLKENNRTITTENDRRSAMAEFLTHVHMKADAEYFAFLRSLGVRAPLTGVNVVNAIFLTPVREQYDYVDNHQYWDHPSFPERAWSLPHKYDNRSATAAAAPLPRSMMPTRILGKPFTVTEWNYTFPNRYRAEGGALMGAYSAFQGWDAIWRFAYSHNRDNITGERVASGFDIAVDPLSLLSERLGVLLFLREDVTRSPQTIPYVVTETNAYPPVTLGWGSGGFPDAFNGLGLHTGIGSVWLEKDKSLRDAKFAVVSPQVSQSQLGQAKPIAAEPDLLQSAIDAGAADGSKVSLDGPIVSDTNELKLDAKGGTFQVMTERTEAFVFDEAGEMSGKAVRARNEVGTAVVSVSAMDGQPIASSKRLLVLHLTDVQNNKIKYRDQHMQVLETFGELPHLVRNGAATIRIDNAADAEVWACDTAGKRLTKIDAQTDGTALTFTAHTHKDGANGMVYEVVKP